MDILNLQCIGAETTEPHHPQQNPGENRIGTVKTKTNRIVDRVGCPDWLWLKVTLYIVELLNVLVHRNSN